MPWRAPSKSWHGGWRVEISEPEDSVSDFLERLEDNVTTGYSGIEAGEVEGIIVRKS
jgi:hypothetical protein